MDDQENIGIDLPETENLKQQPAEPGTTEKCDAGEPPLAGLGLTILKHGGFAIVGPDGDIRHKDASGVTGLYVDDMQHVSELALSIEGYTLRAVDHHVSPDKAELRVRLEDTTGRLKVGNAITVHDSTLYRAIEFHHDGRLGDTPLNLIVNLDRAADFTDMFAVRSEQFRPQYDAAWLGIDGKLSLKRAVTDELNRACFQQTGRDQKLRRSFINTSEDPVSRNGGRARYAMTLDPGERRTLFVEAGAGVPPAARPNAQRYAAALGAVENERSNALQGGTKIRFGNSEVQQWLDRSLVDLAMMTDDDPAGPIICAGLPWFASMLGRDSIITAEEMLWFDPEIARGHLEFLSTRQATQIIPYIEAEPGKILHETRKSESVNAVDPSTGTPYLPFGLYYGGADQTLSYIRLAHAYYHRTGDKQTLQKLWPNIEAALNWAKRKAAESPDGFIGYAPNGPNGLRQQQWEDSDASVMYDNGDSDVAYPRKASTVQGDLYTAWRAAAAMVEILGKPEDAADYADRANKLYKAYNEKFWVETKGAYAHAVDGNGVQCRQTKSASGRAIDSGLVPSDRALKVANVLLAARFFNGFGIRTLPRDSNRYSANGYHNGSVWPYDNALIARGFAKAGLFGAAQQIIQGMQSMAAVLGGTLPELAAGYGPEDGKGLVEFPSACKPYSWSAAAVLMLTQTALGLEIDGLKKEVRINPRAMPKNWGGVQIRDLKISGNSKISFEITKHGEIKELTQSGITVTVYDGRTGALLSSATAATPIRTPTSLVPA